MTYMITHPARSPMTRALVALVAGVLLSAACGGDEAAPAPADEMAGMEGMDMSAGEMDTPDEMPGMDMTSSDEMDPMPGMDMTSSDDVESMDMGREPVMLTSEQERRLGVTFTTVGRMPLERTIRTVGSVEPAESAESAVTLKVDGFVEELFVSTTGHAVKAGEPLLTVYSPELVAAQEQLLTARRLAETVDPTAEEAYRNAQTMLDAARRRLTFWDITTEQIDRILETGEVEKTLTLVSPVDGIVLEKPVVEGQRVSPGTLLYRIVDLLQIWIEGDVFEQDLQLIREGTQAHIEVSAYPGEHFMGRVSFVYPTVDVETRTNRVRVALANPDLRLKPGMFVTVYFDIRFGDDILAVPRDAVIVTGERNLVFVRDAAGMLQPREVILGQAAAGYVQILSGLEEGMEIVGSANFLVDAESRLGGGGGMPGMPGMQMEPRAVVQPDTTMPGMRDQDDD